MIRTRLIKNHRRGCHAVKNYLSGFWNTPWAYFEDVTWRDRRGGKTGSTEMWAVATCNDTDCKAKFLVSMEDIWDSIYKENE